MASDIWRQHEAKRVYRRQSKYNGFVYLLQRMVFIWSLSTILLSTNAASQLGIATGPSPDFSTHRVVRPQVFHARNKREIINTTKINNFEHADMLTIGLDIDGTDHKLDVWLNTDLIPSGYRQRRHVKGNYTTEIPEKVELCHYQGKIHGIEESLVAVSTCRGLRGVIYDGKNMHYIDTDEESLDGIHYLYKDSHLISNKKCGYEGTKTSSSSSNYKNDIMSLRRTRRAVDEVIRGPYNANRQSRYVELVLVIDKAEYIALGENLQKVHHHCKDIANIINALYTPLNIFVALVGVEVWTDGDAITLSSKGDTTLGNFLRYRRESLVKEIPNDNAQLLTRVHFDDGVVGKALKGPICTYEFSGGVSMDHSHVIGLVAATVAHEMGHNFGMEHDTVDCSCPEDRCIMASSSGSTGPVHWSSCSLEYLSLAFEHGMDYCLRNKPKKLFDSPICGNGFVESGEQCDCGLINNCDNPCCNASTCMLHQNASCATGECCDLTTCKPKNAGTQCRTAEHECDLPEYCTGQSEYCPNDVFKIDGEVCNMGNAFCYQGSCRTHNDQCKLLWGPSGLSSGRPCYEMNNKGSKHGNCGYNRLDSSYIRCDNENIWCGMLHCQHLNERLEFGMESVAILSHSFLNHGVKMIACRSAIVDLGLNEVDPGLAPDGAKCAPGKMCVNQKCMPVANLRATINGGSACLNNCGGNGVCNSLGHCHCNKGFRPPDCLQPGFGGSDDSGPAEDPNARNDFITALYIIFLGIVPTVSLISLAVWYKRNNSNGPTWKKESISTNERGFRIETIDRLGKHQRHTPHVIETIDAKLNEDPACTSLLPKTTGNNERFNNNNMFGQFKGFTLSPLPSVVNRENKGGSLIPTIAIKTSRKLSVERDNNTVQSAFTLQPITSINSQPNRESQDLQQSAEPPPALPPLNPGCTAKPLISSPVLAATTCTSMEFVENKKIPSRPAPDIPVRPAEGLNKMSWIVGHTSSHPNTKNSPIIGVGECIQKKVDKDKEKNREKLSTLDRIASIWKPSTSGTKINDYLMKSDEINACPPHNQHHKANKIIDKEILRKLEISNPILQNEIKMTAPVVPLVLSNNDNNDEEKKNIVTRAHSMKSSNVTPRPAIHTFGSMRYSSKSKINSNKRPTSIAVTMRPTSPPPPVPPITQSSTSHFLNNENLKIPGLPGYQNPPIIKMNNKKQSCPENSYDDCMNLKQDSSLNGITEELQVNDNIYAVIEEPISIKADNNHDDDNNAYKVPSSSKRKIIETGEKCRSNNDPTANESPLTMGLLSEIVSEISNRNFDSIYSASSSSKLVGGDEQNSKVNAQMRKNSTGTLGSNGSLITYTNAKEASSSSSLYSNSLSAKFDDSAVSETSSGYLLPSAVNAPKNLMTESGRPNNDMRNKKKLEITSSTKDKSFPCRLKTLDTSDKKSGENIQTVSESEPSELNNASSFENKCINRNSPNDRFKRPDIISSCSASASASISTKKKQSAAPSPDILVDSSDSKMINTLASPTTSSRTNKLNINSSMAPVKLPSAKTITKIPNTSSSLKVSKTTPQESSVSGKRQEINPLGIPSNVVRGFAPSKSTVATLQMKFEQNKTVTTNPKNSISTKKSISGNKNIGNTSNKGTK